MWLGELSVFRCGFRAFSDSRLCKSILIRFIEDFEFNEMGDQKVEIGLVLGRNKIEFILTFVDTFFI